MKSKQQKTVLVTGCSTGFGRLIAETTARRGHTVFATMRDTTGRNRSRAEELEQLATEAELPLRVLELDVADDDSVGRAVGRVIDETGRVDVLVNNAAAMNVGITEAYTLDQVRRQFDVNVYGTARTARAVLPYMRTQQQGLLIQISSLAGRVVFPFFGLYCASKFAVEAMAEAYRYELSPTGVDSVIVEPGPFPTRIIANSPEPGDTERLDSYGELAARPAQVLSSFQQYYDSGEAPDPQLVADAVADLVQAPREQRPLRTVVGLDYGVRDLNRAVETTQRGLLDGLGLTNLDPAPGVAAK